MFIHEAFNEILKNGGFASRNKTAFYEIEKDGRIVRHLKNGKRWWRAYGLDARLKDLLSKDWRVVSEIQNHQAVSH